jgi:hypothetical protein
MSKIVCPPARTLSKFGEGALGKHVVVDLRSLTFITSGFLLKNEDFTIVELSHSHCTATAQTIAKGILIEIGKMKRGPGLTP